MRTQLQVVADRAAATTRRSVGESLRHIREDAGLTRAAVGRAAGVDPTWLRDIEDGEVAASIEVLHRVSAALGTDLGMRVFPNTGPAIGDRFQAPMVEALLGLASHAWSRYPEVHVVRPVRGVIDLVLARPGRILSIEAHSELRRLEQQIRWAGEKSDALSSATIWSELLAVAGASRASRVLLLRSTMATRELAKAFGETLAAAYPADPLAILAALADPTKPWPGDGLLWARVEGGTATILRGVPRGLRRRLG